MNFFTRNRNLFILHFTVLIWGFTGVLGSLISTPALQLVWYRVLIAAITLIGYHFIIRKKMMGKMMKIIKKYPGTFADFSKVNEVFGRFKK